jgi:hypothetical protein
VYEGGGRQDEVRRLDIDQRMVSLLRCLCFNVLCPNHLNICANKLKTNSGNQLFIGPSKDIKRKKKLRTKKRSLSYIIILLHKESIG